MPTAAGLRAAGRRACRCDSAGSGVQARRLAGLLRPTQEQHKSGSRRHPTEKRKVGSSTLPLTTTSWVISQPSYLRRQQEERDSVALEAHPATLSYPRKRYFPDTVFVPDTADERKTIATRRRHSPVPKQLDAGPFEAEVNSFRLHLAAEGKAERTLNTYTEAVRWFAAAHLLRETDKARWEQVERQDLQRWTVWLLVRD